MIEGPRRQVGGLAMVVRRLGGGPSMSRWVWIGCSRWLGVTIVDLKLVLRVGG